MKTLMNIVCLMIGIGAPVIYCWHIPNKLSEGQQWTWSLLGAVACSFLLVGICNSLFYTYNKCCAYIRSKRASKRMEDAKNKNFTRKGKVRERLTRIMQEQGVPCRVADF